MKLIIGLLCALVVPLTAFAGGKRINLTLEGRVYDDPSFHTTDHQHRLRFADEKNDKTYTIVDSPELEQLHHDTDKNYRIELTGYLTPKFLFFGGNLVVTQFKILEDLGEVALSIPIKRRETISEKR